MLTDQNRKPRLLNEDFELRLISAYRNGALKMHDVHEIIVAMLIASNRMTEQDIKAYGTAATEGIKENIITSK